MLNMIVCAETYIPLMYSVIRVGAHLLVEEQKKNLSLSIKPFLVAFMCF